jgi:glycosyltransferase involved in cell wall biosynthesis
MYDGPLQKVSVVVPVYFNAETLPTLIERLRVVADQVPRCQLEMVFVDDGSRDSSFAVLREEAARDSRVRAVRLSRNFGSNVAILAGLAHADGDAVVVISADLQDPPEMIPELVAAWRDGVDVVLAARQSREDPWLSRTLANGFNLLFRRLAFRDFPPGGFDFMLISRRVSRLLVQMEEKNSYIFGQVMWVGFERTVLYYTRAERAGGRSRWTVMRKVKYFIDAFSAFSYLPIRMASVLGFMLAIAGLGYAAVILALILFGAAFDMGHAAIVVTVLIGSGAQLVILGMIGEYLWRVLEESRRRPLYIVDTTVNLDRGETSPSRIPLPEVRETPLPNPPPRGGGQGRGLPPFPE